MYSVQCPCTVMYSVNPTIQLLKVLKVRSIQQSESAIRTSRSYDLIFDTYVFSSRDDSDSAMIPDCRTMSGLASGQLRSPGPEKDSRVSLVAQLRCPEIRIRVLSAHNPRTIVVGHNSDRLRSGIL